VNVIKTALLAASLDVVSLKSSVQLVQTMYSLLGRHDGLTQSLYGHHERVVGEGAAALCRYAERLFALRALL